MEPIGPLMHEHRLIERMVALMWLELERLKRGGEPDLRFANNLVDFFRYFADACHHGKEEEILFREVLAKQGIDERYRTLTNRLKREHIYGREITSRLNEASRKHYVEPGEESAKTIANALQKLVWFYPWHIATEDKEYFHQVMDFFPEDEQRAMLLEYDEVDKRILHERYREMIEEYEGGNRVESP